MNTRIDLQALRRRIGERERLEYPVRPSASLGAAEIDEALPGHGLETGALHEFLPAAHGDFAATIGFGFALASRIVRARPGFVLWVSASHQAFREGALYPVGLTAFGIDPGRLVQVSVARPRNVLWALEEGLSHSPLAAVIGLLPENARAYDFTASRRLAMRAARHGVTALLVRSRSIGDFATAAATRWSVASRLSAADRHAGRSMPGVGAPRWQIRLVKSRRGTAGYRQIVEWDHEALSFRLAPPLADRATLRLDRGQKRERGQERGQEREWAAAS